MASGLVVASLAWLGAAPADAAVKKTQLECSQDWVECQEYCDKFEKPVGGPHHRTCMQACQYTYDRCVAPDPAKFDAHLVVPGNAPGLYNNGSPGPGPQSFQSMPPATKAK